MPLPDIASFDDFGGPLNNYSDIIDPTTDESAVYRNRYASDVAAMGHTGLRAFFSFGGHATTPTDPTGFVHDAMWGTDPSVKPVVTRSNTGLFVGTFPTEVTTELSTATVAQGGGDDVTLNFRRAYAQIECTDGTLRHAVAEVTTANTVTVRTFNAAGTANDVVGFTVTVFVY